MDYNFTVLEEEIFRYFLNKLECYASNKVTEENFPEIFNDWANDKLDSPIYFNLYVNEFFEPKLHLTAKEILLAMRQSKLSFKDYIIGIMKKFDVRSYLMVDNIFKESESSEEQTSAVKQLVINKLLGTDDIDLSKLNNEELDDVLVKAVENPEESDDIEQKKDAVRQKLGNENINVDGLSDEELDTILNSKTMEEKLNLIVSKYEEKTAVYLIHKYVGMNMDESKYVYNDLKGLNE